MADSPVTPGGKTNWAFPDAPQPQGKTNRPPIDYPVQPRTKITDPRVRAMYREVQDELPLNPQVLQSCRPVDVVHTRQQLVKWWSRPGEMQQRFAMQGRREIEGHEGADLDPVGTQIIIYRGMRDAELFWVSPEMSSLVARMASSIPDALPQPPAPAGFVMFAKSIPGVDAATGGVIYTTAFLWHPVETLLGPCVAIETYAWRDIVYMYQVLDEKTQARFREIVPCRLVPTGGSEWPTDQVTSDFTKLTAEDEIMRESMIEDRRLLCTFWAISSQRIAVEEQWQPDRNTRRQAQREHWTHIPAVRIIRLREQMERGEHGDGSRQVEWTHRWWVGEHWRNQWYPSEGTHRPKLIHSYIKGPEDKPLVEQETVRALVR